MESCDASAGTSMSKQSRGATLGPTAGSVVARFGLARGLALEVIAIVSSVRLVAEMNLVSLLQTIRNSSIPGPKVGATSVPATHRQSEPRSPISRSFPLPTPYAFRRCWRDICSCGQRPQLESESATPALMTIKPVAGARVAPEL